MSAAVDPEVGGEPGAEPVAEAAEVRRAQRGPAEAGARPSVGARVNQGLAVAVLGLVGGGFLFWYYGSLSARTNDARAAVERQTQQKLAGEMVLPPLPRAAVTEARQAGERGQTDAFASSAAEPPGTAQAPGFGEEALGGAEVEGFGATGGEVLAAAPGGAALPDPVLQRKLQGPVLMRPAGAQAAMDTEATLAQLGAGASGQVRAPAAGAPGGGSALGGMLAGSAPAMAVASVMRERSFVLPRGSSVDCTLETAIDSTLPGMATCVLAADVFGADGRVVLLERGSRLVGEVRAEVRTGQRRVFVAWAEARTPGGVIAALASPGTDALGRAGVGGEVDNHFGERFGAAILISLLDAATLALVNSQQDGNSVVVSPQGSQQIVAEVLSQTVSIPPTIRVAQGTRLQVLVARDVDFSTVYELRRRRG